MRAGGCAINDYADRDFDPHVARTAERPLAAGRVSGREALAIFVVLSLMALALLLSLRSTLALWLSLPAVALTAAYPFAKRVLAIPQAILGRSEERRVGNEGVSKGRSRWSPYH